MKDDENIRKVVGRKRQTESPAERVFRLREMQLAPLSEDERKRAIWGDDEYIRKVVGRSGQDKD